MQFTKEYNQKLAWVHRGDMCLKCMSKKRSAYWRQGTLSPRNLISKHQLPLSNGFNPYLILSRKYPLQHLCIEEILCRCSVFMCAVCSCLRLQTLRHMCVSVSVCVCVLYPLMLSWSNPRRYESISALCFGPKGQRNVLFVFSTVTYMLSQLPNLYLSSAYKPALIGGYINNFTCSTLFHYSKQQIWNIKQL